MSFDEAGYAKTTYPSTLFLFLSHQITKIISNITNFFFHYYNQKSLMKFSLRSSRFELRVVSLGVQFVIRVVSSVYLFISEVDDIGRVWGVTKISFSFSNAPHGHKIFSSTWIFMWSTQEMRLVCFALVFRLAVKNLFAVLSLRYFWSRKVGSWVNIVRSAFSRHLFKNQRCCSTAAATCYHHAIQ